MDLAKLLKANKPVSVSTSEMTSCEYCVAKQTIPRNYDTLKGVSKEKEYLQIQGVPCKIVKYNNETNMFTLNSFTSGSSRHFTISQEDFDINFIKVNPNSDGDLHLDAYQIPVNVSEFDKREDVKNLEKKIRQIIVNQNVNEIVRKILKDKLFQLIQSQGAPYITIVDYYKFKNGELALSKHKRFGNEIFNRNNRWCPPIDITYEEYSSSPSYPAPLGIRPKDFCLPSELINTIKDLIIQIVNFDGIDENSFEEMKKIIPFIYKKEHVCKYCGEKINIADYYSTYKSCDNYIEICHRDPNDRFLSRNMYWGHGECNRRQGGYSESDRMFDGARLMFLNGVIDEETYQKMIQNMK